MTFQSPSSIADVRASAFSTVTPNFQLAWDSTSLGTFKECPRKYAFTMLSNYHPRGQNVHLTFGTLYHAGLERYDHARASGSDHDTATRIMVRWTLSNSGTRDAEGVFHPWTSGNEYKNRYTLIRTLVWKVEADRGSIYKTVIMDNGRPAVELSFNFEVFDIGGEPVSLCGHLDKVVSDHSEELWIGDHKTTKSALSSHFFASFTPGNQFSQYTLAGKVVMDRPIQGVLINAAQVGVGFSRFQSQPAPRPAAVVNEWLAETRWWLGQAHDMAQANVWPANDKSCGNYGGCPFAKVCAKSPAFRDNYLKMDFDQWVWNPLEVRGDI